MDQTFRWRSKKRLEGSNIIKPEFTQFIGIFGVDILNGLSVILEYVDANDGFVEIGIGWLDKFVVDVFRVFQSVKSWMRGKKRSDEILEKYPNF